jgi:hypothetical protein
MVAERKIRSAVSQKRRWLASTPYIPEIINMSTKPDIYSDNPVVTLEYMAAVIAAVIAGNKPQYAWRNRAYFTWMDVEDVKKMAWDWSTWAYRISPDSRPKKTVPMERDDYPPFFWIREIGSESDFTCYLVTTMKAKSISLYGANVAYGFIASNYQYSTDRKTWKPCTKGVAE